MDSCLNTQSSEIFTERVETISPSQNTDEKSVSKSDGEGRTRLHSSYEFSSIEAFSDFCFNKKYSFPQISKSNPCESKINGAIYKTEKWNSHQLRDFRRLKEELNSVKGELNNYDLTEWHEHTRSTNPAGLVVQRLKNKMKEFVTQAWCKFYELICEFNLIPDDAISSKSLYTVHLCEAPGAFVASLNHFVRSTYADMKWLWLANSLNPYYEGNNPTQMISDDKFMLETIDYWDFGPDETGDVTHPDYADYLKRKCNDHLPHLVTADGSFHCQDRPEEQENSVSWLILRETLVALRILRKGGHFVIKMFTFFECDTICLLYLLNIVFESVDVMKPFTSKEGNSEVYVVCREFRGNDVVEPYLKVLLPISAEEHKEFVMFPYEFVPVDFIENVLECAKRFAGYQTKTIKRNINLFQNRDDEKLRKDLKFVQEKLWRKFLETYHLKPIQLLGPFRNCKTRKRITVIEKREAKQGSHADHLEQKNLSKEEIFRQISNELNDLAYPWIKEFCMPNVDIDMEDFKVITCKPIERVNSSQFCHGQFIRMRNQLMDTISIASYNNFLANISTDINHNRKVCDCRLLCTTNENYSETQMVAFRKICEVLFELKDADDLTLEGFPLLTQFNVNVLCLLKQIFEQIEFRNANTLYLSSISTTKRDEWKTQLNEISQQYTKNCCVLSFLPVYYVAGMKNPLYWWLVEINNNRVYSEMQMFMNSDLNK